MKIDLSMEGMKKAAGGLVALASHANLAIDVVRATLGHTMPDDAHRLAKLVGETTTGGKSSWVDEARMASIKLNKLTAADRKILRGLDSHVGAEYGDGFFGNMMEKRYGNKLRPGLLHLEQPEKTVVDKIARVAGNKTVHDEIVRTVPGNDDDLVKYLKYLVREIRSATKTAGGTEEEKWAAGYRHGLNILKCDGFPDLQFAEAAKIADAVVEAFPDVARAAIATVKQKVPELAGKAEVAVTSRYQAFLVHSDIDNYNLRKENRPGFFGQLSRIFG